MENSNVKENLEVLFEKFKNMIKVETVVGEAVQIGDTTLVPVSYTHLVHILPI